MIAGLATAWPGMPAGKVEPLDGDGLLDIRQKIISNRLDDPADDPCLPFDHFLFDDDSHSFPGDFQIQGYPIYSSDTGWIRKQVLHTSQPATSRQQGQ